MAEQTIELQPSESKVITFEAIPHEAKMYQVSVDGLTGSFIAITPPEAELAGFAYDSSTSKRIPGVTVTIDGKTTTTNSEGIYIFKHLIPGSYTFKFSKGGYEDYVRDIILAEGHNIIHGYLTPVVPPFDPWSYDFNRNKIIETSEMLAAANDYFASIITKEQVDQVYALWEQG